jgi:hypothetical protein
MLLSGYPITYVMMQVVGCLFAFNTSLYFDFTVMGFHMNF